MKPKTWWRIASGLTLFFAVAHSGGMLIPTARGAEEQAVVNHMRSYHFEIMGSSRTYWDFFFGFGLYLTVSLVVMSSLSWKLSGVADKDGRLARQLGWPLLGGQVAFAALSWRYFFLAPALLSSAASLCTLAALLSRRDYSR